MDGSFDRDHLFVIGFIGVTENDLVGSHKIMSAHDDDEEWLTYAFNIGRRARV